MKESMSDEVVIHLKNASETANTAKSFAKTIYGPVTILLTGDLGAGKTTFIQEFAKEMGVEANVTSPTFALEQRYQTMLGPLIHMDLYRLTSEQATKMLRETEHSDAIRCIEWADRLPAGFLVREPVIEMHLEEEGNGRKLTCCFLDAPLPPRDQIEAWREMVRLPAHIQHHCDAVANLCDSFSQEMIGRGMLMRPLLLRRAAELHDLLRFVDFALQATPASHVPLLEDEAVWASWKERTGHVPHERACADILRAEGFSALADIVAVHGVNVPKESRRTIEQKLLYYADKRVIETRVVSLDERFQDFANRYRNGVVSDEQKAWYREVLETEEELFGA